MGLGREEAIAGLLEEYEAFGALVRSLDEKQWEQRSRCAGWTAGDVARHVVGTATEVADELDTALVTLRNLAAIINDDAWNGPSPVPDLTMRQGILTLIYDLYVHDDDIRVAVDLPARDTRLGLDASVEYLAEQLGERGWGPATLALDGMEKTEIGGGGDPITGDAKQFVMVACGRDDPRTLGLDESVNIYADA